MDQTKTALDHEIPLPPVGRRVLREHVAALPPWPMKDAVYPFPSTAGGMRSRSALEKTFQDMTRLLRWKVRFTPRGMCRTVQDLARQAKVHDVVTRATSGHSTERMQRHYSTARREERWHAVGKVISLATARGPRHG